MDLAVMAHGVVNTGCNQNRPYENSGFSNLGMGGAAAGANEVPRDGVSNLGSSETRRRRTTGARHSVRRWMR
jgi:hypothetical protein